MKSELLFQWQWNNAIPDIRKYCLASRHFRNKLVYTYLRPNVFILKVKLMYIKHTNTYLSCFIIHMLLICTNKDEDIYLSACVQVKYSLKSYL